MTGGQDLAHRGKWGVYLLLCAILPLRIFAQIGPPPVITVQPASVTVTNGANATFTVTAVSATRMSYQWYFNGTPISGAGKSDYTRKNVTPANAGKYSVIVANASGAVTSADAWLTILSTSAPPPLRFALTQMTTNGFRMVLSGPSGTNYIIYASNNLNKWSPISTNAAPNGMVDYTDPLGSRRSIRYYRAGLQ